jgi:hypothetical protein
LPFVACVAALVFPAATLAAGNDAGESLGKLMHRYAAELRGLHCFV